MPPLSENHKIIQVFKGILLQLPAHKRRRFWWILAAMVLTGFVETVALGVIALLVSTLSSPEKIIQSENMLRLQQILPLRFFQEPLSLITFISVLVIFLVIAKNFARGVVTYASTLYSAHASAYLGERLYAGFLFVPYEWHLAQNSANLSLSVLWRIHIERFLEAFLAALSDTLMVVIIVAALFILEPFASFIVITISATGSFAIYSYIRTRLDKTTHDSRDFKLVLHRDVTASINAIKDVKIYNKQNSFISNFTYFARKEARMEAMQIFWSQSSQLIIETLGFVILSVTIIFMSIVNHASSVKVMGFLALLAVAAWRILPALTKILNRISLLRISIPFAMKCMDYLEELKSKSISETSALQKIEFERGIFFDNVSFSYRGAEYPIIHNLTVNFAKGKTIGIIGSSGAGKSTLANMLIGLLLPSSGDIRIDDMPLNVQNEASWMEMVGYVPQSAYILDSTIAENIAFGEKQERIDREKVNRCCGMASLLDFVNNLPHGIDTPIGERGVKISGGQQQRIAIARALYKSPEILIFDEATSSLDTQNEKAIQQTIYSLKGDQTMIIIAHRLSTVEECDEVIWLEDGKIVKNGKPEEVLSEYKLI